MDEKEISELLFNQKIYKANLLTKWVAEDMTRLTKEMQDAITAVNNFVKVVGKIKIKKI